MLSYFKDHLHVNLLYPFNLGEKNKKGYCKTWQIMEVSKFPRINSLKERGEGQTMHGNQIFSISIPCV